jgi:hypothetical protein
MEVLGYPRRLIGDESYRDIGLESLVPYIISIVKRYDSYELRCDDSIVGVYNTEKEANLQFGSVMKKAMKGEYALYSYNDRYSTDSPPLSPGMISMLDDDLWDLPAWIPGKENIQPCDDETPLPGEQLTPVLH